eukprot:jgi/Psemu1/284481/fgenesh1_pg.56_\
MEEENPLLLSTPTRDELLLPPQQQQLLPQTPVAEEHGPEKDFAVFGRLNTQLADALAERIEAAIAWGVDSLPLLDDDCYRGSNGRQNNTNSSNNSTIGNPSPKERLRETLRYKFVRNVDVLEAFCAHHVLTLRKHPPARRKRIVAVLRDGPRALDPPLDATAPEIIGDGGNGNAASQSLPEQQQQHYPTRSDLPTPDECASLSRDLDRLRADLAEARSRRNELVAELASIRRAGDVAAGAAGAIRESSATVGNARLKVRGFVEDSRVLDQLKDDAKTLTGKLDTIKRNRDPSDTGTTFGVGDDDPLDRIIAKRPKVLAPMEAYQRDRRVLGLLRDSTNDSVNDNGNTNGNATRLELLKSVRGMLTASEPAPSEVHQKE